MAREIVYSPQALRDLLSIEEWIAQDRPRAANDVIKRILDRIDDLLQFPLQGRKGGRPDTRELVITRTPYIATYTVRGDDIYIVAIRHGARRPLG